MEKPNAITVIKNEIDLMLQNKETAQALIMTTFKGLTQESMRQAMMEGMIRGFTLKDFLEKKVYAIPFKDGYTLVSSIDQIREKGARAGIVGKEAPVYELGENGSIISCLITVHKRQPDGYVGDFTATVYFAEYYKPGKNGYPSLWDTKPRTMIAKVGEAHAYRMACPAELANDYVAEEFEREDKPAEVKPTMDLDGYKANLYAAKDLEDLADIWVSLPGEAKKELEAVKDEMKTKFGAK